MDKLAAMQTFVRVVESGSFSAVARETRSTQSGVSKQVAALERGLGAQLLSRTPVEFDDTDHGAIAADDVFRKRYRIPVYVMNSEF